MNDNLTDVDSGSYDASRFDEHMAPQRNGTGCLGIFIAVVLGIIVAAWLITAYAQSHQQVTETTCGIVACTQVTLPVQQP